ncbi:Uncharacterized membrane protein [Caldanaerobius fijiensis DSM 17918]|uniref:Uncharacterized membrane protein n=1 Tax=Caldanaerobius fijiensis DSM 17918 TaxID=1121256 RepID=A0A1M4T0V9_9THEO|nr:DUF1614 domain-containing protein [Caldanaerobius fijiensis]SHE37897.1 Uncharacterized membrane protein [Caldanaerobius fijiensis DSM 17918]
MPLGYILLMIVGVLVIFGFAHRVLDRMGLSDKGALIVIIAMILGSFIPDIPLGRLISINIGGAIIPIALCIYLIVRADEPKEKIRAVISSLVTGVAVFIVAKIIPNEPEAMIIEPMFIYGVIGGIVAYLFGRSRRSSFIGGILGIIINDIIQLAVNLSKGIIQPIVLGGAGFLDAIVLSGLISVMLAEFVGEIRERLQGGTAKKDLQYEGGGFTSSIGLDDESNAERANSKNQDKYDLDFEESRDDVVDDNSIVRITIERGENGERVQNKDNNE